jgi:cob(I)alamin adenosyltransferase
MTPCPADFASENGSHLPAGYVHVYTGDGKGKTTAALGLALRAVGAGLRVYIGQFVKGMHYSELDGLAMLGDRVEVHRYGRGCFIRREPDAEDVQAARQGLQAAREALSCGEYDLVILDEINVAVYFGLISADDVLGLIEARPDHVELVLTGRRADPSVIDRADVVTEMREIKHYYARGVQARTGIER